MTSFYERYIYAIPTIILMFAVGISFFRKLNHVDPSPSPIEAIKDNPQKIVSTNEYEKITASTKKSMIKDKRIPQFFPGHAKRFNWKAFNWNFENGMSNSYENNIKVEYRRSKIPSFMYTDSAFQKVSGDIINTEEIYASSTMFTLLKTIEASKRTKTSYFYYLTYPLEGKLSRLLKSLKPSMPNFEMFFFDNDGDDNANKLKDDKNKSSTFPFSSIWIGSKGVTTRLHYDIPNNLFVQIKGRKTFYIYPPSLNLKFYPYLHPAARKSRILDILNNKTTDRSSLKEIEKYLQVYTLNEGDVLYIPGMFAHHVVSNDNAISVNTFAKSDILNLIEEIEKHPIPFESFWSETQLQIGTSMWLHAILLHFYSDEKSIESFVAKFRKMSYIDYNVLNFKVLDSNFECFDSKDKHLNENSKYKFIDKTKFQTRLKSFIGIFEKYGFGNDGNINDEMGDIILIKQGQIELILGRYLENLIFNFVLNDKERTGGHHNSVVSKFLKQCFM